MVDEKEMGEEEYHFSEDNPEYDMTSASGVAGSETQSAPPPAKSVAVRLQEHRRIIIGIFVFILLLGAVYKMLLPSNSAPSAEIVQSATPGKKTTPTTSVRPQTAPAMESSAGSSAASSSSSVAPDVTESATASTPSQSQPAAPMPAEPAAAAVSDQAMTSLLARIAAVEQQNTAIMNTLQTQYVQKAADVEMQASQMRNDMKTLKAQVAEVEQAFHQLSTLLQKQATNSTPQASMPAQAKAPQTGKQSGYSVQAIIPGRAWLKSDSGDTVTVAEGDILRGVGRVTRIDPYDGLVNLDTGHKIITLSYGMGTDE